MAVAPHTEADAKLQLWRFLFLGVDESIYTPYVTKIESSVDNLIRRLIQQGQGEELVKLVKKCSKRCCKFYPLAYCLAACARSSDEHVSQYAYDVIRDVCKTPTQLFLFLHYCKTSYNLKGWPRKHRRAITKWYTDNAKYRDDLQLLAKHVTKYKKRHNYTHKKIIKSCHPKTQNPVFKYIFCYITKGLKRANALGIEETLNPRMIDDIKEVISDIETIKSRTIPEEDLIHVIKKWKLSWEHIPTEFLMSREVWRALLHHMPMTALIRNLGRLSKLGLLQPGSEEERVVCEKLDNRNILEKANLHHIHLLSALAGYRRGRGLRGNQRRWPINQDVVHSLSKAYMDTLRKSSRGGKRILVAINVNMAMNTHVAGNPVLSCKQAAVALAMTMFMCEQSQETVTFGSITLPFEFTFNDHQNSIFDMEIELERVLEREDFGPCTRFNSPFQYAIDRATQNPHHKFDAVLLLTGAMYHEYYQEINQCFKQYKTIQNSAKCVIVCLKNSKVVPLPEDPDMLEVVGLDANSIEIIQSFIHGYAEEVRQVIDGLEELRVEVDMEEG